MVLLHTGRKICTNGCHNAFIENHLNLVSAPRTVRTLSYNYILDHLYVKLYPNMTQPYNGHAIDALGPFKIQSSAMKL